MSARSCPAPRWELVLPAGRGAVARWRAAAGLLAAATLAACSHPGPLPPAPAPRSAAAAGLPDRPAAAAAAPAPRWWDALGDAGVAALIDQALREHPSLALAQARVARAQSLAAGVQAAGGAQATLNADVSLQRFSAHGLVPPALAGLTRTSASVMAGASWSPDLFGRHAADLAAAAGQAQAAQADAALAATGLAAQVARGWVHLARTLAHQALAERVQRQRQAWQALARQRVAAGLDNRLALLQADAALHEARAEVEALAEQVALARRQLAVLSGQAPDALDALAPDLAALRLPPPPAAPGADLLGRRPDIVAARWRIEAAGHDLASARAQFYPDVNLSALAGLNALGLHHLLDLGSRQAQVAPALRLPLFDGGRLRAQQGVRQAELAAAVALYDMVLLDAVREAGDALTSRAALERQQAEQAAALAGAEAAWALARERHAAGLTNRLAVLQAEGQWLQQSRLAVELQAGRLQGHVQLLKALGGGWSDSAGRPAS